MFFQDHGRQHCAAVGNVRRACKWVQSIIKAVSSGLRRAQEDVRLQQQSRSVLSCAAALGGT